MAQVSKCPAWCRREGEHKFNHYAILASDAGITVWLRQVIAARAPYVVLHIKSDDGLVFSMYPRLEDLHTLAEMLRNLGRDKLAEAVRQAGREILPVTDVTGVGA